MILDKLLVRDCTIIFFANSCLENIKNISEIELEVDSENIPATKLYDSIGFKKINQTYWY